MYFSAYDGGALFMEDDNDEMMTDEELTWFNEYHQTVYDRLNPYLNTEEQAWLKEATAPLKR